MHPKKLYLYYGIAIALLGLLGFMLTHAKSALISGLASGAILILVSFFAEAKVGSVIAKVINILLLAVFSWRSTLAITALSNGHPGKLIPSVLLSLMALISVSALAISFLTKDRVSKDRI